jgi:hypothetical protein
MSRRQPVRGLAVAMLTLASALSGCAEEQPRVHTGPLATPPAARAPHVIEATFEAPVAGPPAREIAFGITEDQLPLNLTIEDLQLGASASGALLVAILAAFFVSWLMGLATPRRRQALATATTDNAPSSAVAPSIATEPARTAPIAAPASAATPLTPAVERLLEAQQAQLAQQQAARAQVPALLVPSPTTSVVVAPPANPPAAPPPANRVAEWTAPSEPMGPSNLQRTTERMTAATRAVGTSAGDATQAVGHAFAAAARATANGAVRGVRWASMGAAASWRLLASAPRRAWHERARRRSPFREGGEFWVRGTEMQRMGVQNEAERHYWNGFYECEHQGWDIEGAECLRQLAHIAAKRSEFDEAVRHLEMARALLEHHGEGTRLEAVQSEIRQFTAAARLRGPAQVN